MCLGNFVINFRRRNAQKCTLFCSYYEIGLRQNVVPCFQHPRYELAMKVLSSNQRVVELNDTRNK